jgi:hypothetical protein
MIKKFNDYKNTRILDNERESLERELRARKIKRENTKKELIINLDLIIREIMYSIANDEDYVLSLGKRKEELEGTSETVFHIEFENERLGRVRIFKPKDTSDKGHYEVNGEYYETSAKEIRDLYNTLNQEIKGNEMIVRTSVTESLTTKMVGKSDEELEKAIDNLLDKATLFAMEYYPERFDDYLDTFEWLEVYYDNIVTEYENGELIEDIVKGIIDGKW